MKNTVNFLISILVIVTLILGFVVIEAKLERQDTTQVIQALKDQRGQAIDWHMLPQGDYVVLKLVDSNVAMVSLKDTPRQKFFVTELAVDELKEGAWLFVH